LQIYSGSLSPNDPVIIELSKYGYRNYLQLIYIGDSYAFKMNFTLFLDGNYMIIMMFMELTCPVKFSTEEIKY